MPHQRKVRYLASVCRIILLVSASANAGPITWSGEVEATIGASNPIQTGLTVQSGSLITVRVQGEITLGDTMRDFGEVCGPSGSAFYRESFPNCYGKKVLGDTHGIIILSINDTRVPIDGGTRTFASPNRGPVRLFINDDQLDDNRGSFQVSVIVQSPPVGDADQDDIPDLLEDQILQAFSPTLYFDSDERFRPSDAYWFLRNGMLTGQFFEGTLCEDCDGFCDYAVGVPFYPEKYLDPFRRGALGPLASLFWIDFCDVLFYGDTNYSRAIGIYDNYRHGLSWSQIGPRKNVGMYGHVTPIAQDSWAIQYYPFFAHNDAFFPDGFFCVDDPADHEGDWELFELFVDPLSDVSQASPSKIQRALWHFHGVPDEQLPSWSRTSGWTNLTGTPPPRATMLCQHPGV